MNEDVIYYPRLKRFLDKIDDLTCKEIDALIAVLQKEAQLRETNGRKVFEDSKSGVTIEEFTKEIEMTQRLKYALREMGDHSGRSFIDEITRKKFLQFRNVGEKSWSEFIDIIDNRLQGTRFEAQQDFLRKHFKIEH